MKEVNEKATIPATLLFSDYVRESSSERLEELVRTAGRTRINR